MRPKIYLFVLFLFGVTQLRAQYYNKVSSKHESDADVAAFGLGMGLDYGGLAGAKILVYPQKNFGLFFGGGYALVGFGYNTGVKIRLSTSTTVRPFLTGMYGYNAVIQVTNATQFNKIFYGTTFGGGIDIKPGGSNGYWSFGLLIPVRGPEVDAYINYLQTQGVVTKNSLSPVGISAGYHFIIN